ncbi:hypothetical protein AAHN97_22920 [Chitinophaga niabensis]|uniref:hypothetical protein n=1 Tax=Chitinophaga niabensis TaxID=536979 RepID=UPI0031BB8662
MNNYKKAFCTFSDSRLRKSLNRIKQQAEEMEVYNIINIFDETQLDPAFRERFRDHLYPGSRGYGFWSWKPQVILQTLRKLNDGDVVQYTDTGCHLNKNGKKRLEEYFNIAHNSPNGILAFKSKSKDTAIGNETFYENFEYKYNKGDVFNYFNVLDKPDFTHSVQYEAGITFIRKSPETVKFVEDWIHAFTTNFDLISDAPSKVPNLPGFVDHRHDQGIYSILCKKFGVSELFSNEYFTSGDWAELNDFPIWVKRDMKFGTILRAKRFIRRNTRLLLKKIGLSNNK